MVMHPHHNTVWHVREPPNADFVHLVDRAVKHCRKLRASRAYREESGSVLIVGQTPIQELADRTSVRVLFLAEGAASPAGVAEAF